MKMIKNIKWLAFVALAFVACNSDDDVIVDPNSTDGTALTAGTADFSKFVALGDSFTAGYSDNALFMEGQKNAFPSIMASQFALVGGGDFATPFMNDNIGGFSIGGAQIPQFGVRLYFNGAIPVPVSGVSTTDITAKVTGPFNNFGIPGAKGTHLDLMGFGSAAGNPYFTRMATSAGATVVDDAVAGNPTFFSLWIGGNDVLGYATSGGLSTSPITPVAAFDAAYTSLITKLTAGGRKGVVANLPYVSTLPIFTTVPYNALPLNAAQVSALNSGYAQYNGGLQLAAANNLITPAEATRRTINFVVGQNPVVIDDEYLTTVSIPGVITLPKYRQTTSEDLILLFSGGVSVQAHLAGGNGSQFPLADKWVLSKDEIAEIKTATDAYNVTIQSVVTANPNTIALVDAKALMGQISTTGVVANNFTIKSTYVTGGMFSLDGVHPSPRGYALIANSFLKAINTTFGSNFKGVNVGKYRILYPMDSANF